MAWASTAFAQADLAVISGGEDGAVKLWPLCDLGIPEGDGSSKAGYPAKHACSKLWHVPQAEEPAAKEAVKSESLFCLFVSLVFVLVFEISSVKLVDTLLSRTGFGKWRCFPTARPWWPPILARSTACCCLVVE